MVTANLYHWEKAEFALEYQWGIYFCLEPRSVAPDLRLSEQAMNLDGSVIFSGVNFVLAPLMNVTKRSSVAFQSALIESEVDFSAVQYVEQPQPAILVTRNPPNQLQAKVGIAMPPNIGQLIVIAEGQGQSLDNFIAEAEAIANSFDMIWPPQNRQVISRDVTMRYLHSTSKADAFEEIWVTMLRQKVDVLKPFGQKVHGGGVRFVIAPVPKDPEPHEVQVKIESFLTDQQKVFIEVQFIWGQPMPSNSRLDASSLLKMVDTYLEDNVMRFITEAQH